MDNCDINVGIIVMDDFVVSGDCGDVVIIWIFMVIDDNGCIDNCQQQIIFCKLMLDDVNLFFFIVVIECDEDYLILVNGNLSFELIGYLFIFMVFGIFDIVFFYCNIGVFFDDILVIDECNGCFKFCWEWIIFDWCDLGSFLVVNQLIKVGDFMVFQILCLVGILLVYFFSLFVCIVVFVVFMLANILDNCLNVSVYMEIVIEVEDSIFN